MDAEMEKIKQLYPGYEDVELPPTSFGARLRQTRKELGETQDEFAAALSKALEDRTHPRVIVMDVCRSFV